MARRQAVVLIQGIGEKIPLQNLKAFVHAIWSTDDSIHQPYGSQEVWSKPDDISGSFELRRPTMGRNRAEIGADFFEYYWAHLAQDTKIGQVTGWLPAARCRPCSGSGYGFWRCRRLCGEAYSPMPYIGRCPRVVERHRSWWGCGGRWGWPVIRRWGCSLVKGMTVRIGDPPKVILNRQYPPLMCRAFRGAWHRTAGRNADRHGFGQRAFGVLPCNRGENEWRTG